MDVVGVTGTAGPFERLVDALAAFRASQPDAHVWVQSGKTRLPPGLDGADYEPHSDLLVRFDAADVIVCHAGCGTIGEALSMGHCPVVVPRRAHLGEHVNDHQLEIAGAVADDAVVVHDIAELPAAIAAAARRRRRGERDPQAVARTASLVDAIRCELADVAARRPARRAPIVWGALRFVTRLVRPKRYHDP